MKTFIVKNRGRIIAALFIVALLAAAWFYGDGSGKKGSKEAVTQTASAFVSPTPTPVANENITPEVTQKPSPSGEGGGQRPADEGLTPAATDTLTPTQITTPTSAPTATSTPAPTKTPTPSPTVAPTPSPTVTPQDNHVCTISIDCKTILSHLDGMNPKLKKMIPEDGVILAGETVAFDEGDSVFDVLKKICRQKDISLEFSFVPAFNTVYIEGIADIYEFDAGNLSGWQYFVNGEYVPLGCSAKKLSDGDVITWRYTCDLGRDL